MASVTFEKYHMDMSAKLVDTMKAVKKEASGQKRVHVPIQEQIDMVQESHRFALPYGGRYISAGSGELPPDLAIEMLRIPFPSTLLQFRDEDFDSDYGEGFSNYLVMEMSPAVLKRFRKSYTFDTPIGAGADELAAKPGSFGIIDFPAAMTARQNYKVMPVMCWVFHPDDIEFTSKGSITIRRVATGVAIQPTVEDDMQMLAALSTGGEEFGEEKGIGLRFQLEVLRPLWNIMDFCITLNCANVQTEKVLPPKKEQNTRRALGRTPFSEFHVLVIKGKDSTERLIDVEADTESGGSGIRVKFHFRRGHIRRLGDGRCIWVRSTTVGDPSLGTVKHRYEVEAAG